MRNSWQIHSYDASTEVSKQLIQQKLLTDNHLGDGFKYVFVPPLPGEMIRFELRIFFQMGWFIHQLDNQHLTDTFPKGTDLEPFLSFFSKWGA